MRPRWPDLPVPVRARIERALGAEVIDAVSQGSGFTCGFASRLQLSDGRRVFVKAIDDRWPVLTDAYRLEAAKLALLPATVPAPRLQQVLDEPLAGRDWVVLVFDDVEGRPPCRPWRLDEARTALATAAAIAEALTPPPPGWPWGRLADELFDAPPDWGTLRDRPAWVVRR